MSNVNRKHTIKFTYRNHRGKESQRTVDVDAVEFVHKPGFGYQPGWVISGFDHDKQARRSFKLSHIVFPDPPEVNAPIFRLLAL